MAIYGIPRGKLVSFGSSNSPASAGDRLIFSGTGAVSADADNSAPNVLVAGVDAFDSLTAQQFGVNKSGFSARPFKDSLITWTYYVSATAGLSESATWADLETRLNQLYLWYWGTYTYTNSAGTTTRSGASGQAGDLVVQDAGGTPRIARAEWVSFPDHIPPGQVGFYEVDLVFRLTGHFQ